MLEALRPTLPVGGRERILVAVIDSGWRGERTDRVLPGLSLTTDRATHTIWISDCDEDESGHGTLCGRNILACAPSAWLVPVRILTSDGSAPVEALAAAIQLCADAEVPILSLSLGSTDSRVAAVLQPVVDRAISAGCVMVAAQSETSSLYPASIPGMIAVRQKIIDDESDVSLDVNIEIDSSARADLLAPSVFSDAGQWCGTSRREYGPSAACAIASGRIAELVARAEFGSARKFRTKADVIELVRLARACPSSPRDKAL